MIVEPHPCISSAHEAKRQSLLYSLSCSKFFFINRYRFQNRYSMKVFPFIYQKYYIFSFNLLHYHSASHRSSFHSPPPPPACSASPPPPPGGYNYNLPTFPPAILPLPNQLNQLNHQNSKLKPPPHPPPLNASSTHTLPTCSPIRHLLAFVRCEKTKREKFWGFLIVD